MSNLPRKYRMYSYYTGGRHHPDFLKPAYEAGHARYPQPEEPQPTHREREAYHRGWRCAEHEHRARVVESQKGERLEKLKAANRERREWLAKEAEKASGPARKKGADLWRRGTTPAGLKALHGNDADFKFVKAGYDEARAAYLKSLLPTTLEETVP